MTDFFADSYALLAFLAGDPGYQKRFEGAGFRTSILNLLEVHYAQVSRGVPEPEAQGNLSPFELAAVTPDWPVLRQASIFRRDLRAEGLACSYIDAVGYAQARHLGLPFLTGDPAFEGIDGVEFLREKKARLPSRKSRKRR